MFIALLFVIKANTNKFDTSIYQRNNIYYDIPIKNKAILGFYKDVAEGK